MTALAINNLTADADLHAVKGGWSEIFSVYRGVSTSFSNWSYKGTSYSYQGLRSTSKGLAYLYHKKIAYERTERRTYNYDSFWK